MGGNESGPPVLRTLSSVGPRSRELTGAVDLLTHYGLQDLYDHFCAKPLPVSIADSQYLQHVVGDTEIRKGEGMEFQQLNAVDPANESTTRTGSVGTLDLQLLQWAFTLSESGPIELREADKGQETISGNVKDEKDKKQHKKKHKKHKDREKDKDKAKKKEKVKDPTKGQDDEKRLKKHRKKKRKYDGAGEEGDGRKHKKKKTRHQVDPA